MAKNKVSWKKLKILLGLVIIAVVGWAIFNLVNDNLANSLHSIGITDTNLQYMIIIIVGLGLFVVISGKSVYSALKSALD